MKTIIVLLIACSFVWGQRPAAGAGSVGGSSTGGTCATLAGDVTGTCAANTVVKINGTALSSLATGPLCNTTGTGVPSICNVANQSLRALGATFTGNGSALSGTATDCQEVTSGGTINAVYTVADVSGSVTVDIRTVAYASYTGIAGFSGYTSIINAGTAPSLSSAVKYTDSTLTSWSLTLTAGTVFCVQISSPATVQNVKVKVLYAAN